MSEQSEKPETDPKPGLRQDGVTPSDKNWPENSQAELDERLDEALEETFPSSDPVSVKITK
ncbi:hypothetical protein G3T14_05045 [Methylobacterium sp. BTF04]|uniref:hypothetical protein n=1 Tax=Methylobacterium sp. BTF04 TaxID=2708300 RepID=UPI0013D380E8|nr:hypothetical protein [Methylobacterium sp. BTF04]NEU11493.1 hypothetical protein [Methylobacterium sp. BTF04]